MNVTDYFISTLCYFDNEAARQATHKKKKNNNERNKKPEQRLICPFGESLLAYKISGAYHFKMHAKAPTTRTKLNQE